MSGYAVIGWGSLIWDLEVLAPNVTGGWRMREGPRLTLEFSRISPKRKMGLVVCLDPEHGTPCDSHWILSRRRTLRGAVIDLARRERAIPTRIGAVCTASGHSQGRLDPVVRTIRDWCLANGLKGAVWTDLESNFAEHRGQRFSVDGAIAYLDRLTGESRAEAVRYIENAPVTTDTPLRRALADHAPWRKDAATVQCAPGASNAPPSHPPIRRTAE